MKHNWEYKPVSEVFETVTDFVAAGSFADLRDNVIYNSEKDFAQLIRTTDLKNNFSNQQFVYVNEHAFNYLWRVNLSEECIILPNIGNGGEVYYLHPSMLVYPNNVLGPNAIMVRSKSHNQKYLAFALKGSIFQRQLSQIISQVAQSKFNKTNLKKLLLPVPPMEVQEQIVAELDKINEVIANCRELLRNLDALAQSLFYDTFGDPITNTKGWKSQTLAELCTVTSSNRIFAEEYCDEGIPFYRGKEISELSRGEKISIELFISANRYEKLKSANNVPQINDILITAVGTIGNIWVVDTLSPFYFKDGNIIWLKDINFKVSNSKYFRYLLYRLIDIEKNKMVNGSAYKALTIQNLKKLSVFLPPLSLQEKFAERIEQIETQKKIVESTIAELQTLLDSRMDYWFN